MEYEENHHTIDPASESNISRKDNIILDFTHLNLTGGGLRTIIETSQDQDSEYCPTLLLVVGTVALDASFENKAPGIGELSADVPWPSIYKKPEKFVISLQAIDASSDSVVQCDRVEIDIIDQPPVKTECSMSGIDCDTWVLKRPDFIPEYMKNYKWYIPNVFFHDSILEIPKHWNDYELNSRRRCVRFYTNATMNNVYISCETISQDEFNRLAKNGDLGAGSAVIVSCIRRESETGLVFHYITSVDIIRILARICGISESDDNEKNRMRRNMECLKPATINEKDSEFLKLIMGLPAPRPYQIRKKIKVFLWATLAQALMKVFDKYVFISNGPDSSHLFTMTKKEIEESPSESTTGSSSNSEEC